MFNYEKNKTLITAERHNFHIWKYTDFMCADATLLLADNYNHMHAKNSSTDKKRRENGDFRKQPWRKVDG